MGLEAVIVESTKIKKQDVKEHHEGFQGSPKRERRKPKEKGRIRGTVGDSQAFIYWKYIVEICIFSV